MPKYDFKNQAGAASGKQALIITVATIIAALMIVAIFIILSGRQAPDTATDDFLQNIQKQRQGREENTETSAPIDSSVSFVGVLTEINPDALVITVPDTQNKISINFDANTPVTYNGQTFNRSKFYIGDQLEITAKKFITNGQESWRAESIIVLVSASPATAAPVPPAVNVQPDGTIKPL